MGDCAFGGACARSPATPACYPSSRPPVKGGRDPRLRRGERGVAFSASFPRHPHNVPMHIWVDADACPAVIKDILYRAAERLKIPLTLVANKLLRTPPSQFIRAVQVPRGIDVADSRIVQDLSAGDLVITADIPLASDVIKKGGHALNPRGEFYTT